MTSVTRSSRSGLSSGLVVGVALALAMVAAPTAAHATPKIGLVLKPLDNTYFGAMARGAEAAASALSSSATTSNK